MYCSSNELCGSKTQRFNTGPYHSQPLDSDVIRCSEPANRCVRQELSCSVTTPVYQMDVSKRFQHKNSNVPCDPYWQLGGHFERVSAPEFFLCNWLPVVATRGRFESFRTKIVIFLVSLTGKMGTFRNSSICRIIPVYK
jgi:hypothetical protein